MTAYPNVPVSEFEDAAFNELGAGSDQRPRNGADAPARIEDARDAALSRPHAFPQPTDGHPPLTDAVAATHQAPAGPSHPLGGAPTSAMSPAGVRARRGSTREGSRPVSFTTLQMSPVAFTLGIWALYALMALTAWRAVR